MEPWFGNHGNFPRWTFQFTRFAAASMEPWFGNHGNAMSALYEDALTKGFNGAVVR